MIITLYSQLKDDRLRYYTLHNRQLSLDQRFTLTASRHTENAPDRERFYTFDSIQEMDNKIHQLFTRAIRRGYTLLYSFNREGLGRFGIQNSTLLDADAQAVEVKSRKHA